ncbi:hypothetical protein PtA15_15A91 [Puccinia triticina]|uniref:Uncharacterized protein n=1 Tax=Puccinia triticina TaxID=208348 RepID=A0ABY7D6U0_9BASI|nr:uncharacterized protein PtA15_15A91 [Puccinia triticina]WAQ91700.1 hypothetical protein PtA15_15A91 [Puccinia triticina]
MPQGRSKLLLRGEADALENMPPSAVCPWLQRSLSHSEHTTKTGRAHVRAWMAGESLYCPHRRLQASAPPKHSGSGNGPISLDQDLRGFAGKFVGALCAPAALPHPHIHRKTLNPAQPPSRASGTVVGAHERSVLPGPFPRCIIPRETELSLGWGPGGLVERAQQAAADPDTPAADGDVRTISRLRAARTGPFGGPLPIFTSW